MSGNAAPLIASSQIALLDMRSRESYAAAQDRFSGSHQLRAGMAETWRIVARFGTSADALAPRVFNVRIGALQRGWPELADFS
jgi:hypothetical protein